VKTIIFFSTLILSTIGGWIGQIMDHGNWLGGWSILLSTIGAFIGIWVGYKGGKYFGA
jgi:membrane protein DedA with SNARE-associated domain